MDRDLQDKNLRAGLFAASVAIILFGLTFLISQAYIT